MEENETKNSKDFKAITDAKVNYSYNNEKIRKGNPFIPFLGGLVGGALVVSICLGVPNIRENIFTTTRF